RASQNHASLGRAIISFLGVSYQDSVSLTLLSRGKWQSQRSSRALSPATPRNGINRGTGLEERVVRAFDAVHEAQRVECQRTLSSIVVGRRVVHREDAEFHGGPVVGPDGRRVVHRVSLGRKLDDEAKLRRPL